jgi:ABC-type polysaccharide/polyol phosphate transport system ATPase subunit
MSTAIRFEGVSKTYRLGESRRSLREAVYTMVRSLVSPGSNSEESILWALRGVSFDVAIGEALGLIGPNGAGKTTILKLLSNITQPTYGRIHVNGRISALIELGAGFHPDLTGRENIYLNAAILGLSRREVDRLFDQIVAFSGLERFIDTPVKRYSSGMYVRLGFSVAAHVEPDILLVDEVLAVGDSQFRQRCARRIEKLRGLGTTIVFVSHNLPLLRSVCDTAIFLADGQIQAQGDVVDVITAYETHLHQMQTAIAPELAFDGSESLDSSSVEISQIEIRGLSGDRVDGLSPTDAAEVRVHFWAREPVREPNLVVRIVRADGVTCCMIRTGDGGCALDDLDGQGVISVGIDPLQLTGGAYLIDARLTGALDGLPLAHRHSQWFQVTGFSLDPSETGGVFVPHIAWTRVEQGDRPKHKGGSLG